MRAICGVASVLAVAADVQSQWETWKIEFGRVYNGESEEKLRFDIFSNNVKHIEEINAQNRSFKFGTNQFSDLSPEEFKSTYLKYSKPVVRNSDAYLGQHVWTGETLPDSVDWHDAGAVTPIKDQGQCGSCWSFSTTGGLEGAYQIKSGQLISLSEQQYVDCAPFPNQGCNGGSMDFGLRYAKDHDLCLEDSYPYEAQTKKCRASGCTVGLHKGVVTGVKDLAVVPEVVPASQANMQSAVAQQPVSVAVDAGAFQSYQSGVLDEDMCGTKLDHGVLVVGYGTYEGDNYWKIKNSWGPQWGMDGFILLKRGGGGKGVCGLLLDPAYPVIGNVEVSV